VSPADREANVALVRRQFDLFESRDLDGLFDASAHDVEVGGAPELPNSGTYQGQEGFLTWIGQWLDAWDEFRIELVDAEAIDDEHVVATVVQRGRGKGSGLEVTQSGLAYLVTIRDGVVRRLFLYPDRDAALVAAGHG
jgi:ketosteroid isomerase-like protein